MSLTCIYRGRITGLVFALAAGVSASGALADGPNLLTAGNTFTSDSHYVSTTVFTWYSSTGGQSVGPWRPLEGRLNWTGEPAWWQSQIKQMMAAKIDVIQAVMFSDNGGGWYDQHRTNLFQALHDLRVQGYNVPKVVPFLDTAITTDRGWTPGAGRVPVNLGTEAGKDAFVQQYIDFYNQYYSVNTDAQADSYIAQIDGRVVLDTYVINSSIATNVSSLTRANVQSRLTTALGGTHALFGSLPADGIFMIRSVQSTLGFADEKLAQFEPTTSPYYDLQVQGARRAAQVKAGYWDQNIRNPGTIWKRNGGTLYASAWSSALAAKNGGLKHVNVESWNEYDEGSGIYAADPGAPYIQPGSGNTQTDTWSTTNDPYEYIKTTARWADMFNDTTSRDARILWNNLPATMRPGQTGTYQVIVRNDGDQGWTNVGGFKFGEKELVDPVLFGPSRYVIDDATNEIPTYGSIFRGRPITFDIQLTAPTTPGVYTTHWSMVRGDTEWDTEWFGQELVLPITVMVPEPSVLVLLATGMLALMVGIAARRTRAEGAKGVSRNIPPNGQKGTRAENFLQLLDSIATIGYKEP